MEPNLLIGRILEGFLTQKELTSLTSLPISPPFKIRINQEFFPNPGQNQFGLIINYQPNKVLK